MRSSATWIPLTTCCCCCLLVYLAAQVGSSSAAGNQTAGPSNKTQLESQEQAQQQQQQQQQQREIKLPLYMRIIATLACLIIFSVGICGNLLVPLVVIKTKYLRNSTNLFLINLSLADLVVLSVCMPTVLIELHSRPETWILGEPMCKISNFVEMLAANGSIFTILAISFERYYAICKPLKAGYKCTRMRATIIICIIWLLSSLLTSPILIMAKSQETIYMDDSLVYNCILEANTEWQKMYVVVSMIAFFCLPLLILMLVYWLIGRRLIRENIAMSTVTMGSSNQVDSRHHHHHLQTATTNNHGISNCKNSSFNFSIFFSKCYHKDVKKPIDIKTDDTSIKRSILSSNKTLSLDNHLLRSEKQTKVNIKPRTYSQIGLASSCNMTTVTQANIDHTLDSEGSPSKASLSLAMRFIYQLFHLNSSKRTTIMMDSRNKTDTSEILAHSNAGKETFISSQTTASSDDQSSQTPFLMHHNSTLPDDTHRRIERDANEVNVSPQRDTGKGHPKRSRFNWAKGFSISSSLSTSLQTNSTALPSESSYEPSQSSSLVQTLPHPIIHNSNHSKEKTTDARNHSKKFTRFKVDTLMDSSRQTAPSCSSMSESYSSPYSSKSPSPDYLVGQQSCRASYGCDDIQLIKHQPSQQSNALSRLQANRSFSVTEDNKSENDNKSELTLERQDSNALQMIHCDTNQYFINQREGSHDGLIQGRKKVTDSSGSKMASINANGTNGNLLIDGNDSHSLLKFATKRAKRFSQPLVCSNFQGEARLSDLMVIHDISKKQQMDSRRQVVIMLAFVVACFFLLFFPYRVFTIWLILATDDQVQSLGMETYYNVTYFSRILIYLHSAINPIAYNLISTKFRRAFVSILLCRGSESRRHFTTDHHKVNQQLKLSNGQKK